MNRRLLLGVAVLFIFGGILAPLGDLCHFLSGTLAYPLTTSKLPGCELPWWDPLLFGSAVLGMGLPDLLGILPIKKDGRASSLALIIASTTAFLGLYAISGFLPLQTGGVRDGVLAVVAFGIWFIWDRSALTFILGVIVAIIGASVEIFLVSRGVFYYLAPNFFGIASWIPWLYFAAIVPVRALAQRFAR